LLNKRIYGLKYHILLNYVIFISPLTVSSLSWDWRQAFSKRHRSRGLRFENLCALWNRDARNWDLWGSV